MRIMPRSVSTLSKSMKERLSKVDPATIGHWIHFGFMRPRIKAMLSNVKVVGTAFTVKTTGLDSIMVHKAVSLAQEGDVLVIDRNGEEKHACVGEMIVYAAKIRKLAGIIVDGPITDIQAIREIGLPVYATGLSPITTRLIGNSGEINTTIQCGGVSVNPGDIILGDDNGILVMDKNEDVEAWVLKAEEKEQHEQVMKEELEKLVPLASLTNADNLLKKKGIIK